MTDLSEFLVLPFVELEIRFGTLQFNKFDASIDRKYFEIIENGLKSSTIPWETVEKKETVEYSKDNLRLINFKDNENLILKENILKKTVQMNNSPFDIRLSINQEFKYNNELKNFTKNDCTVRNKKRVSFIAKDYRYDITFVKETINKITKEKLELELEILVTKDTLTWNNQYIQDFIECKVYDIVNIVEPIDREKFKLNLT
jgi:hypothetical protein